MTNYSFALIVLALLLPAGLSADGWRTISLSDSRRVAEQPRMLKSLTLMANEAAIAAVEDIGAGYTTMDDVWVSVIDARDRWDPKIGSYRGTEPVYPASVVKLCYMAEAFDQLETGMLQWDWQLERDLDRMIVVSGNVETNDILERVTGSDDGPSLEGEAWETFRYKRHRVARSMEALGLDGLYPVNKTYSQGIRLYGRELDFLGEPSGDNYEFSNMMTTDDTARLLYLLHRRALVSPEASESMLRLMRRTEEKQKTFLYQVKPEPARMYSKDGSTGLCRHDAAIFEFEDGGAIIMVIFSKTRNVPSGEERPQVIERIAENLFGHLMEQP